MISSNFQKPIRSDDVAKATASDPVLSFVMKLVKNGWPDSCKKGEVDAGFFSRRHELTIERETIMWGHRVVIPGIFRRALLEEVHSTHIGIVRAKALVRSYFWWPGIDKDVEDLIKSCSVCRTNQKNPPKVEAMPWPKSERPLQRVHIDYCGPIRGDNYFVLIDTYTKWLEVIRTKQITAEKTIRLLRSIFSRLGVPETIVSDNATAFTSFKFRQFCAMNAIKHITSPAYHPASNGQAENSVGTFKSGFIKLMDDSRNTSGCDLDEVVDRFLYLNRNTRHATTGQSPFSLMFNRKPILRWERLLSSNEPSDRSIPSQNVKNFKISDRVYVKMFNNDKWQEEEIAKILGVNSYLVRINGKLFKRHADHLSLAKNDNKIGIKDLVPNNSKINEGRLCQKNLQQVLMEPVRQLPVSEGIVGEVEATDEPNAEIFDEIIITNPVSATVIDEVDEDVKGQRSKRVIKKPNRLDL